jgi:O-antigen chain-terminating methyltransferase
VSESGDRPTRPWPERTPVNRELIERLNREWRITAPPAGGGSLRQRLARPLRQAVAALLRPQETFNSAVVQQINHLNEVNDATAAWLRAVLDDVFARSEQLADELRGRMDDLERRVESMSAGKVRIEAGMAGLREDQAEMRTALGVLQHETRHLSKALADTASAVAMPAAASSGAVAAPRASSHALSHRYVGFEDAFRGSPEAIRAGLAVYVPLFAGASDVLDIGCGRGEFLSLLEESGITARGVDLNEAMVEVCESRGLKAAAADALSYLCEQPDGSLGGLFAAQVVEHLEPAYLTQLLDSAFDKLRPGAPIVLETINPACWFAFFESYIRDVTHERALHPDTLKFLLVATGFHEVAIRFSAPYPEHEKLQPVRSSGLPVDAVETLNANVEKVNRLLFTHLDYAAIARRP